MRRGPRKGGKGNLANVLMLIAAAIWGGGLLVYTIKTFTDPGARVTANDGSMGAGNAGELRLAQAQLMSLQNQLAEKDAALSHAKKEVEELRGRIPPGDNAAPEKGPATYRGWGAVAEMGAEHHVAQARDPPQGPLAVGDCTFDGPHKGWLSECSRDCAPYPDVFSAAKACAEEPTCGGIVGTGSGV